MPSNALSLREREEIRAGIARGRTVVEIARYLGRHRCTISAEIHRNGGREHYRAWRAQRRAVEQRRRPKVPVFDRCPGLRAHVIARLEAKDSPMTIAVELSQGVYREIDQTVSHETIYQAIYNHHRPGGLPRDLFRCLHRRRRIRVRHGFRRPQQHWRATQRSISERPQAAQDRAEVGHLEGDLIVGKGQGSALITVFDRHSRHLWLGRLPSGRSATSTLRALTKLLRRIPPHARRTLTWDQGGEMRLYTDLEKRVDITVYFADPHSPWQRPTNENGNGLIRRYVGKPTDLSKFTNADLRAIETRINTMPRRIHNWTSAQTVYDQNVAMTS
jgi:IS30 family transposase